MEEREKGLSSGTSESPVTLDEKVVGGTLEGSLDCGGHIQMEGSFSENGKDVMVEVLGSDVYIDGVCTRGSGAELSDEVGVGGSVEGGERLEKDVKSRAVESEEDRSQNAAVELDDIVLVREGRDEDGVRLADATPGNIEVPIAAGDGALGDKMMNARCDNALGCSLTGSSVGVEHVQRGSAEEDNQKERNLIANGESGDVNAVTVETLDEQKNSDDLQSDKVLEKESRVCDRVEFEEKSNSVGEQPKEIVKVYGSSNTVPEEVVGGTEVARGKALLNFEVKQSFTLEKCTDKERIADTSHVSSDTGQGIVEKDKAGVSALDSCPTEEVESSKSVSDADQCGSREGLETEAERIKTTEHTEDIKEEDTQIAGQGGVALKDDGNEKFHDESNTRQIVEVQAGNSDHVGSNGDQEVEEFNETEQRKSVDRRVTRSAFMKPCVRYLLPTDKEGEFSVSDMVWGKVRSHPWWPGQIFDPSDASDKAMKHYKKDCYLVAYFGDRTFAWNEASQLKPFRTHFSSIEKQSTSESFQNAVDCALDEVSRRVEYGLSCSCIPKDTYDSIQCQTVENAGIQQERNLKREVDESLNASSFSPDRLIKYLKTLSQFPTGGFDRLELGIAKAQLLAFYRFKGYSCLPELQYCGGELQYCGGLDNDKDTLVHDEKKVRYIIEYATPEIEIDGQAGLGNLKSQSSSRRKRKHNLKDTMHQTKKERRLSELMGGTPDSPDGGYWSDEKATDNLISSGHSKKKKTVDHYAADSTKQDGRKTISLAQVSNTTRQSFKIGDCIRRVASQLTGSPSMLKCSTDQSQKTDASNHGFSGNGSDAYFQDFDEAQRSSEMFPTEYSSLNDLLSSLQLVAQEPCGDFSSLNAMVSFFSDFRDSVIVAEDSLKEILRADKGGTKRKKSSIVGSPKTFDFEDMNDTYWTDRVIDNGNEEQTVQAVQPSRRNHKKDYQIVLAEPRKPVQVHRRSYSRKQYFDGNHTEAPEKPSGYIDENAPAELVMNFAELDSVPSETNLNKMFRRFGPLKESETEVDRVSSRARVVFKKCADAEVAYSSAEKFNIFGPILVNYQLNYTPSALFKTSFVATTQDDQEMHLDLSNFDVNMV